MVALIFSVAAGLLAFALSFAVGDFVRCFVGVVAASLLAGLAAYLQTHVKFAKGLPGTAWWKTVHRTAMHMRFYDRRLSTNVGWARQAIAIDERRKDFDHVGWGGAGSWRQTNPGEPEWLEQIWFAGNHADIGGGYPEPESRLSDITLKWMVDAATAVPGGLKIAGSALKTWPDAAGVQHDECRSMTFRFGKKIDRYVDPEFRIHSSVMDRFRLEAVQQYDLDKPYRPLKLAGHPQFSSFYSCEPMSEA